MPQNPIPPKDSLIPPRPIPAAAHAFSKSVSGLMDGQPKNAAAVAKAFEGMDEIFDLIAAGLYSLASMLVGEGEDSVRLVVGSYVRQGRIRAKREDILSRWREETAWGAEKLCVTGWAEESGDSGRSDHSRGRRQL